MEVINIPGLVWAMRFSVWLDSPINFLCEGTNHCLEYPHCLSVHFHGYNEKRINLESKYEASRIREWNSWPLRIEVLFQSVSLSYVDSGWQNDSSLNSQIQNNLKRCQKLKQEGLMSQKL